jgi:hypothetical protein
MPQSRVEEGSSNRASLLVRDQLIPQNTVASARAPPSPPPRPRPRQSFPPHAPSRSPSRSTAPPSSPQPSSPQRRPRVPRRPPSSPQRRPRVPSTAPPSSPQSEARSGERKPWPPVAVPPVWSAALTSWPSWPPVAVPSPRVCKLQAGRPPSPTFTAGMEGGRLSCPLPPRAPRAASPVPSLPVLRRVSQHPGSGELLEGSGELLEGSARAPGNLLAPTSS